MPTGVNKDTDMHTHACTHARTHTHIHAYAQAHTHVIGISQPSDLGLIELHNHFGTNMMSGLGIAGRVVKT